MVGALRKLEPEISPPAISLYHFRKGPKSGPDCAGVVKALTQS
ncbi:hypothetical protein SynPROSU1_01624 [Synechococcus sp. PROS-U-1]|nr:hypothetical protein SynPROSU1_01624 [Synechococcus sp. PROS-U-1]